MKNSICFIFILFFAGFNAIAGPKRVNERQAKGPLSKMAKIETEDGETADTREDGEEAPPRGPGAKNTQPTSGLIFSSWNPETRSFGATTEQSPKPGTGIITFRLNHSKSQAGNRGGSPAVSATRVPVQQHPPGQSRPCPQQPWEVPTLAIVSPADKSTPMVEERGEMLPPLGFPMEPLPVGEPVAPAAHGDYLVERTLKKCLNQRGYKTVDYSGPEEDGMEVFSGGEDNREVSADGYKIARMYATEIWAKKIEDGCDAKGPYQVWEEYHIPDDPKAPVKRILHKFRCVQG